MSQTVVADTFKHEDTGKIHLVDVYYPGVMWHCFCSFVQHHEPTEREVDLDNPDVCSTCASGYREEHGVVEEEPDDPRTTSETNEDSALTSTASALQSENETDTGTDSETETKKVDTSNTALASTETVLDS